jgi:hypothetical protein
MKLKSLILIAVGLMQVACASSGPISIGKDTFMITKQSSTGYHSGASVKADLYREASEYCARQRLNFQPVRERAKDGVPGYAFANAEVIFRCLADGDGELSRPTPKPLPNVIIENRNR